MLVGRVAFPRSPQTDLVLLAEVQAIKGNAVDLVPEQVLQGEFWLDTLRVWMQTRGLLPAAR